ncbi:MAG: hypothetical protein J5825_10350 [Lachnospiraceae bacterium]|nr:hypothetical protein [Lachnospiraceae bacterium]
MKLKKFFQYSLPIGLVGLVINIVLFVTNFFYELVVPIIENSGLDGFAFHFFDYLIYFTPCIFMVLFALYLIGGLVYKRYYYPKVEEKISGEIAQKNAERQKELDDKLEFLSHTYYRNCPNCAAPRGANETVCSSCGTSLIIK